MTLCRGNVLPDFSETPRRLLDIIVLIPWDRVEASNYGHKQEMTLTLSYLITIEGATAAIDQLFLFWFDFDR